jgi:large subunit ribosomal protein L6
MSRVGRSPIAVPSNVTVTLIGATVSVKGPQGTLERQLPEGITVAQEGDTLVVSRPDDERRHRALHGLSRSLVAKGPGALELALGFSHPVLVDAPEGITFEVPVPTRVIVKGIDKEKVGQVAADIRKLRKPEPYKGKGVRYANERVLRKAGKAAK